MTPSGLSDAALSPCRRAALAIHCLHPDDRRWLAASLASAALDQVQPLLDELISLGVPADPGFLREILLAEADKPPVSPARRRIETATPRELWKLLRGEPPVLTGWLLACGPWPWEPNFRKKLDSGQRELVEQVRNRSVCPKATDALLEALAGRLSEGDTTWFQRAVRALSHFRVRK